MKMKDEGPKSNNNELFANTNVTIRSEEPIALQKDINNNYILIIKKEPRQTGDHGVPGGTETFTFGYCPVRFFD
jgi:hypothetical protein